jgi:antibiotic biosynthesis monooxygenase
MIAIIFEVWPNQNRKQDYLDIAATLRPLLETIDGFISVERFESLTEPGKILSLSFFSRRGSCAGLAQSNSPSGSPSQRPRRGLCQLSPAGRRRCPRLWVTRT